MTRTVHISSTLRMLLILCKWKKEERQALLTCAPIVKCSPKMAQWLRAEGDGMMLLSPIMVRVSVTETREYFHHSVLANSLSSMSLSL